jgi:hypothetical protein
VAEGLMLAEGWPVAAPPWVAALDAGRALAALAQADRPAATTAPATASAVRRLAKGMPVPVTGRSRCTA